MKQCPTCNRTYADQTLTYCLEDGALLSSPHDPQATHRFPPARATNSAATEVLPVSPSYSQPTQHKNRLWPMYLAIVLLLIVFGGGALVWLLWAPKSKPQESSPSSRAKASNETTQGNSSKSSENRDLLFEETFTGTSLTSDWQILTGEWTIKDGALNGASNQKTSYGTPVWAIITLDKELPANYSISFRTKIISGELTELMLHLSNNRYVRVYLYSIDQAVVLGDGKILQENRPGEIGADKIMDSLGGGGSVARQGFPVLTNTWYNVRVVATGSTYAIFVGGQRIIQYEDEKGLLNKEGTIGFISNGQMQFDDIKIAGIRE